MTGSSLPSSAACVRSRPNFSSDWYLSSGFSSVTRCGPRTAPIASTTSSLRAPLRRSASPAAEPWAARESSRCSVETYSSRNWPSSRSAARRTATSSREMVGSVAAPWIVGSLSSAVLTSLADRLRARAELVEDGHDDAVLLLEQDGEQVLGGGLGVVARRSERRGGLERLAGLGGEAVKLHARKISVGWTEIVAERSRRFQSVVVVAAPPSAAPAALAGGVVAALAAVVVVVDRGHRGDHRRRGGRGARSRRRRGRALAAGTGSAVARGRGVAVAVAVAVGARSAPAPEGSADSPTRCVESELAA